MRNSNEACCPRQMLKKMRARKMRRKMLRTMRARENMPRQTWRKMLQSRSQNKDATKMRLDGQKMRQRCSLLVLRVWEVRAVCDPNNEALGHVRFNVPLRFCNFGHDFDFLFLSGQRRSQEVWHPLPAETFPLPTTMPITHLK